MYRTGYKYKFTDSIGDILLDFDTTKQDLISYSIAHDTLFAKAGGLVVVGAYSFQVPPSAVIGDQYFMQYGSPSATADGVGAPGAGIFIQAPAQSQAVTVGTPSYVVGDAAPFHWLNAGDFGDGVLDNSDVMQVFQSGILGVDMDLVIPPGSSRLVRAGTDVTVVTWGHALHKVVPIAERLEADGISVEIIDPRWLDRASFDREGVLEAVGRTGALVIVEDSLRSFSMGGPILDFLFPDLFSPVSKPLESYVHVRDADIEAAITTAARAAHHKS